MQRKTTALVMMVGMLGGVAGAWGQIDPPPGPVTGTMKPLTEVEPRTALSAANTPGDAQAVFVISKPGSYYLASNLVVPGGKSGIRIEADDVSIDLLGFSVSGGLKGVTASTLHTGVEIRNGSFRGADYGVFLPDNMGAHVVVRDVRVADMAFNGIYLGEYSSVIGCSVSGTVGTGILVGNDGSVLDSGVSGCGGGILASQRAMIVRCRSTATASDGIRAGLSSRMESCVVVSSGGDGFDVISNSSLTDCTVTASAVGFNVTGVGSTLTGCRANSNTSHGFKLTDENELQDCVADRNILTGISAGAACVVTDCKARRNGTQGIIIGTNSVLTGSYATMNGQAGNYTGIWINGNDCRVENNQSTWNDFGFYSTGTDNILARNTARGNSTNFDIAAGNEVAPILLNPGSNGYAGSTAWSNIAY